MANETSGRRDNRVPFRASTKTPNIMMLRRTRFLLIVCGILAFAVLGIKLFNVMIVHHDEYEKMAIDQQVRETEITASRGAIYDTNGKILAMNASVDTIFISPAEIAKNKEDPQLIARELSEILDVDYNKILAMTKNTDRWYEVVKRKVEPDVSEKVRAFKKENKLIGVKIEPDTKRYYPYGSLAAHVIGFVGQDNEGRYGLEQRYDSYLTGSTGRIIRATDNRGTDMLFVNYEDYHDETKGNDMNLTIDATIQYYLEKHLQQAVEDYDVQNGAAAIAMDPNSDLSASKIVNYNRESQRRVDLTFGADYTCRPEQVKAALHNALSLVPGILPEPEPFVRVSGYGESNIEYTVRVWCKTADYWTVYYDLMEAVGAAFDAHGVSMSYPQMNVHVLDTPESAKKD